MIKTILAVAALAAGGTSNLPVSKEGLKGEEVRFVSPSESEARKSRSQRRSEERLKRKGRKI